MQKIFCAGSADDIKTKETIRKTFEDKNYVLNREKISEDVAICFVYDFFTLKNKEDSTDVGGLTYLPQSRIEEFSEFAQRNYYKN